MLLHRIARTPSGSTLAKGWSSGVRVVEEVVHAPRKVQLSNVWGVLPKAQPRGALGVLDPLTPLGP